MPETIKKLISFVLLYTVLSGSITQIFATETRLGEDRRFSNFIVYKSKASDIEKEWNQFVLKSHQEWDNYKSSVQNKWNELVFSTNREWVSYDDDNQTRIRVDFKDGQIKIETLVDEGSKQEPDKIYNRVYNQLKKILHKAVGKNESVIKGMVKIKTKTLSKDNLHDLFSEQLYQDIKKSPNLVKSKDRIIRQKYTLSIPMVSGHLDIRAEQYAIEVKKQAMRFSLEPALIMAIIHTESYFNPLAVSDKGAIGLMQIVPKWGGKEAYEFLYGESFDIQPEFLYAPGINLELGTAYLYLLHTRYFSFAKDSEKIKHLSICAYNYGPTALNKRITKRYRVKAMSTEKLYKILITNTPKETRQYLQKVMKREKKYQAYFLRNSKNGTVK